MKQKPCGFYEAARLRHEAKRTFFILRVANQRFIAEGCFIFHAPSVRFISKNQKKHFFSKCFRFLELLPRFELGTSSLPRMCSTN